MIPLIPGLLKKKSAWLALVVAAIVAALTTTDLATGVDRFWKEPRDLLVDRVEDARDSQQAAAEEFRDALTEFKSVVDVAPSDLERQYSRLNAAYERSASAAGDIGKRVDRVVSASNRLLEEWRDELAQYNDPALKQLAQQQFDDTRAHARKLIESMRQSEQSMQPVLASFRDQVLYLKHNLNLSAIAALEGEAATIETDVDALIEEMNRAIADADAFLVAMLEQRT
jgi:hypothetical protein